MSKGSPRITVRIPQSLLDQMNVEIRLLEQTSIRGVEDVTTFILRAVEERIAHRRRSRAKRNNRQSAKQAIWPEEIVNLCDPVNSQWI